MELSTITMKKEEAVEQLRAYRDAARRPTSRARDEADRELARIDVAVKRGLRELARGHALLELTPAVRAGGVEELAGVKRSRWSDDVIAVQLPRIAVCRADARYVFTSGIHPAGAVNFFADGFRNKPDTVHVDAFDADDDRKVPSDPRLRALVPTIPPRLRPPHKLSGYHLLFEAEWAEHAPPVPEDPALLKHLGGDLYVLLAVGT